MKLNKKFKMMFLIVLILTICIVCKKSYAFMAVSDNSVGYIVSYGIGIFLIIWQWIQYIFPILLTLILIIINRKKLNYIKIIIFIILGIIIFGACYFTGELVLKNNLYTHYSSGRMDIMKYNGKSVYIHK